MILTISESEDNLSASDLWSTLPSFDQIQGNARYRYAFRFTFTESFDIGTYDVWAAAFKNSLINVCLWCKTIKTISLCLCCRFSSAGHTADCFSSFEGPYSNSSRQTCRSFRSSLLSQQLFLFLTNGDKVRPLYNLCDKKFFVQKLSQTNSYG